MLDKETGWHEADVTINGRALSFVESMTLRVAISDFRMSLKARSTAEALGTLADGYDYHLAAIEAMIFKKEA